jgi:hypothetical protein
MSSILKVDQLQDSGGNNLVTSNGSGVITAAGFGKVGQVVYTEDRTNTFTTSSTSAVDVTFDSTVFTASITPTSTSSKILCMGIVPGRGTYNGGYDARFGFAVLAKIGSGSYTEIYGDASNASYFGGYDYGASGLQVGISVPVNVLYSPNTTSAVTFKYQVKLSSSSASLVVNRQAIGTSFTLMEILP